MVHLRSPESLERREQKRQAKQYILGMGYQDFRRAETVCLSTPSMVLDFLRSKFESVLVSAVHVDRGEVLLDSRGEGSFQK